MKFSLPIFLLVISLNLGFAEESGIDAYEELKKETGLTDEELRKPIKQFAEFVRIYEDELDAGSLDPKKLVESAKEFDQIVANMQRQDELTAALTLAFLRTLETRGAEKAGEFMAKQLNSFAENDFPDTESYRKVRARIEEYSKTSAAFKRLMQSSEQADDAN